MPGSKLRRLRARLMSVLALSSAMLLIASIAFAVTVDPPVNDFILEEGETWTELITVDIPADTTVDAVDIYLLADTTGSMGGPINSVRAGARTIVEELADEFPEVSIAYGVGDFKDFQSPSQRDPYAFRHSLSMTDDVDAVEAAINGWSASGGGDGPEGQFYAYDQIARNRAPSADDSPAGTIGWRSGAKRILVTFADAPAHDPVCSAITAQVAGHEVGYDITEASVISQFNAAGITFVGVSTLTGIGSMDATQSSAGNYNAACGPDISPGSRAGGQATRIAEATGGVHILGVDSASIVEVISEEISIAISTILELSLSPEGDIVPFVAGITFVGVSTLTGIGSMDATQSGAGNYSSACGPDISPESRAGGQATRIAEATGGVHILGVDSASVVEVISEEISIAISTILELSLSPAGDIVPFVAGITPESEGPINTEEDSTWEFEVDWEGVVAAAAEDQVFTGRLNVVADGVVLAFKEVTITVPGTEGVYPPVPEVEVLPQVLYPPVPEVIAEAQPATPVTAKPDFTG